jgi:rubrerythrin
MKNSQRCYPHPVLSFYADDLVDSKFETTMSVSLIGSEYQIDTNVSLVNEDLSRYLHSGDVSYAYHVECARTMFRKVFITDSNAYSFSIDADYLDNRVEVCPMIIAFKDIQKYYSKSFNPDYDNRFFPVLKGDVLAVDRDFVFFANKEMDHLKKFSSIFEIQKDKGKDAPSIDVDYFSSNKITIILAEGNYILFEKMKAFTDISHVLASLIIIPALVQVLEYVKNNPGGADALKGKPWFEVLSKRMEAIGSNISDFTDNSINIAQKLIDEPLAKSLNTINEYVDTIPQE